MEIRWNRFGAVVCALIGTLCLAPALAATAQPGAHTARAHRVAKGAAQQAPAAAKGQRAKPHATVGTARKAGKPHAVGVGTRPANRATLRAQRKPAPARHGAVRHVAGKKPVRAAAVHAIKPAAKPAVHKARGPATGKRSVHKPASLRPGHKKTAH